MHFETASSQNDWPQSCTKPQRCAGGGTGVVSHAGLGLVRQVPNCTGLTADLSAALPTTAALNKARRYSWSQIIKAVAFLARVRETTGV